MSRGLQNCNPGNIRQSKVRYKGEVRPSRDSAFKQFESLAWGYRAIFVLLDTYRIRYGLDTIRGMISRWAPPSENHTETYIRAVADAVGIPDGQPLDTRDRTTMLRMAAAVSRVENGAATQRTRCPAVYTQLTNSRSRVSPPNADATPRPKRRP